MNLADPRSTLKLHACHQHCQVGNVYVQCSAAKSCRSKLDIAQAHLFKAMRYDLGISSPRAIHGKNILQTKREQATAAESPSARRDVASLGCVIERPAGRAEGKHLKESKGVCIP